MLELALCAVAAILALGGAAFVARASADVGQPATVRAVRLVRDDAVVGAAVSAIALVTMALGRAFGSGSHTMGPAAWSGASCAAGALAAIAARAWRERVASSSPAAGAVGEQVVVVCGLVVLTAAAAAATHTLSDPQRLAPELPQLVVAFALGCVALDVGAPASEGGTVGSRALPSVAAMVLGSYFFDANAGTLRSAPSYASALGVVLFPLAATALGAVGASIAVLVQGQRGERALRGNLAGVLALPAVAGAALALLGWVWQPLALCGALGATMTLVPALVRAEGRPRESAALAALAAAAVGSYAVAQHSGLAHAGPFGLAVAAVAAESAALLDRESDHESGALADRQAAALAAIAVALAVLDGAVLARCTRFAEAAHAPAGDSATMLAHCTLAHIAPARIDLSHPVPVVAALGALAACVLAREGTALAQRLVVTGLVIAGVVAAAASAHFLFALGLEALAAGALASSLAAALFPSTCSRSVAALIAATGLALGAAVA